MQARTQGHIFPRKRLWWVGLRNIQCNHEEVSAFFMKLLNVLQVSEPVWSMDDMFTIDGEQRAAEAAALGVPLLSQCGNKESKSSKSEPDYKLEHLETFAQYDLLWPPVLSSSPDIQFVGYASTRERGGSFPPHRIPNAFQRPHTVLRHQPNAGTHLACPIQ